MTFSEQKARDVNFLAQTAQDYGLELHIVENAYRLHKGTWAFYNELEQLVKYFGSL